MRATLLLLLLIPLTAVLSFVFLIVRPWARALDALEEEARDRARW